MTLSLDEELIQQLKKKKNLNVSALVNEFLKNHLAGKTESYVGSKEVKRPTIRMVQKEVVTHVPQQREVRYALIGHTWDSHGCPKCEQSIQEINKREVECPRHGVFRKAPR